MTEVKCLKCGEIRSNVEQQKRCWKCGSSEYKLTEQSNSKIPEKEVMPISSESSNSELLAKQYAGKMVSGLLWAIGGTIVTVATYEAASEGGTYFIAWGAIVFGIIDFFRGLFGWMTQQ